ncbi:hypothetical protein ASG30_17365 [Ramlibacter sp. Leaf400]|nr:hypothetical protein ASG30_17365 [Ramlibacter sp. Leaf400]
MTSSSASVAITLPANECLQAGDRIRVSGQSGAAWRLAQNPLQWVETVGVPGNVTPGTVWTPRTVDAAAPLQNWVATASSASGNRIAAVASPGGLYLSQDGGASWTRSSAPTANWTWVAMNEEGSRLAAVATGGAIHVSSDHGQTWTAANSTAQPWSGVHISGDGQRIVATAVGGAIHRSVDGGASFSVVPGTAGGDWRAVAGSRDGQRLVAVASFYSQAPSLQGIHVSTDGGATWTRRQGNGNWAFAAASADGGRMAAIDNGGNPWISDDGGVTWTMRFGFSNWSGLAVSGNGQVVSALEPRDDTYAYTGYTFVSTDGGTDWNWHGENRWYRGVSLSFDGNWIVVGDTGANGSGGRLYTSQGNRTSGGTLGSIGGGQGQVLQLTYQGNGRFTVTHHEGGAFTIR